MAIFIRKNILLPVISFGAADGTTTQPTSAYIVLSYLDLSGAAHTITITLSYSATLTLNGRTFTNVWTGSWDSSAAGSCVVTWFVYGIGALQAAAQGQFQVTANPLNTV